MISLLHKSQR